MQLLVRTWVLASMLTAAVHAADTPLGFDDPTLQARYENLLAELRCLVCQNQSLADSHADLADDLRREVHRLVAEGADEDEIHAFMVARYGDFVLYDPPLKTSTGLLWLGPLALALAGLIAVARIARAPREPARPLDDAERTRLQTLLEESQRDG